MYRPEVTSLTVEIWAMMHKSRGMAGLGHISGLLSLVFYVWLKEGRFCKKTTKKQSSSYLPLKDWESLYLVPSQNFFHLWLVHVFVNSANVPQYLSWGSCGERLVGGSVPCLYFRSLPPRRVGCDARPEVCSDRFFLVEASLSALLAELPDRQWSELVWRIPRSAHCPLI